MKPIINIAIVGYGAIAHSHAMGIMTANIQMNLPFEMRLSHIVYWNYETPPFSNIKMCQNIEEVLEDKETPVDIIDIANINEAHFDAIQKAIAAGKAIYCEKPITECTDKSKEAVENTETRGLINRVPLIYRYIPCVHLLKEELKNDSLGNVISFESHLYHCSYLAEQKRNTWRAKSKAGGGAIIDLSIHMLDLVRFIFGELSSVETITDIHFPDVVNDEIANSKIITVSGIKGEVRTSRIYKQKIQENNIVVYCEKGSYYCDLTKPYELEINYFRGNRIYKKTRDEKIMNYVLPESKSGNFHQDAHTACIADIAHEVFDGNCSGFGAKMKDAYIVQSFLDNRRSYD